jgi:hypothetical protein
MAPLTRTERKLRAEVEEIASVAEMDVWNIEQDERGPLRIEKLKMMKDKLVRSEVIMRYTLIDEFLTDTICDYYFHRPKEVSYRAATDFADRRSKLIVAGTAIFFVGEVVLSRALNSRHKKPVGVDRWGRLLMANDYDASSAPISCG